MGWDQLSNGELLAAAEAAGFDVLLTGDQNIAYQHDNTRRLIALLVVTQTKRRLIMAHHMIVSAALARCRPNSYELVFIPGDQRPPRPAAS